jgi:NADPH2 dehydrogenase
MNTTSHRHFRYASLREIRSDVERLGLDIRFEEELRAVWEPVLIGPRTVGNAFALQPMEGCDSSLDGRPGELTFRRWKRFGEGGAKLIWGEATAVVPDGRANPRQLMLTSDTADAFAELVDETRAAHLRVFDRDDDLLIGLQLTHSGRYSHTKPVTAWHHPCLDPLTFVDRSRMLRMDESWHPAEDDYLDDLQDSYVNAASLARNAGFDFVDLKLCHGYLLHELLAARSRPGRYGGSFENRTRFVRETLTRIRTLHDSDFILACRLNVYDGLPYVADPVTGVGRPVAFPLPYDCGFGMDREAPEREDLAEPFQLLRLLEECGVSLVNVTIGNPYVNPHFGRPYERPSEGGYLSPEHPLASVDRHFRLAAAVQKEFPDLAVVGTGYSWLQRFLPYAAEASVRSGHVALAGVGRGALAYPDFVRDLAADRSMDSKKVCLAVGFCTDLMKSKNNELGQYPSGCVPRDRLYAGIYREAKGKA